MHSSTNVMVFCEVSEGTLAPIVAETMACGRRLADTQGWKLTMDLAPKPRYPYIGPD
jgi:hypothetical protein